MSSYKEGKKVCFLGFKGILKQKCFFTFLIPVLLIAAVTFYQGYEGQIAVYRYRVRVAPGGPTDYEIKATAIDDTSQIEFSVSNYVPGDTLVFLTPAKIFLKPITKTIDSKEQTVFFLNQYVRVDSGGRWPIKKKINTVVVGSGVKGQTLVMFYPELIHFDWTRSVVGLLTKSGLLLLAALVGFVVATIALISIVFSFGKPDARDRLVRRPREMSYACLWMIPLAAFLILFIIASFVWPDFSAHKQLKNDNNSISLSPMGTLAKRAGYGRPIPETLTPYDTLYLWATKRFFMWTEPRREEHYLNGFWVVVEDYDDEDIPYWPADTMFVIKPGMEIVRAMYVPDKEQLKEIRRVRRKRKEEPDYGSVPWDQKLHYYLKRSHSTFKEAYYPALLFFGLSFIFGFIFIRYGIKGSKNLPPYEKQEAPEFVEPEVLTEEEARERFQERGVQITAMSDIEKTTATIGALVRTITEELSGAYKTGRTANVVKKWRVRLEDYNFRQEVETKIKNIDELNKFRDSVRELLTAGLKDKKAVSGLEADIAQDEARKAKAEKEKKQYGHPSREMEKRQIKAKYQSRILKLSLDSIKEYLQQGRLKEQYSTLINEAFKQTNNANDFLDKLIIDSNIDVQTFKSIIQDIIREDKKSAFEKEYQDQDESWQQRKAGKAHKKMALRELHENLKEYRKKEKEEPEMKDYWAGLIKATQAEIAKIENELRNM